MIRALLVLAALCVVLTMCVYARAQNSPAIDIIIFGRTSSASGSTGSGCANQLVLDYSNSCALIGQAWGQ